jgi:hypothetical protein
MKPMLLADAGELIGVLSQDVEAARASDGASAMAKMAPFRNSGQTSPRRMWDMWIFRTPGIGRAMNKHFNTILLRRGAAVALAGRMYEVKYGKKARWVTELVPEFLPSVPPDPVNGGGTVVQVMGPATGPSRDKNRY